MIMDSEIRKQLIDQPLHVLMCVASVLAISLVFYLTAAYTFWQCFPLAAILPATVFGVLGTGLWVAIREYVQYPPREGREYDVWLDAVFEIIGIVGGAALFYYVVGPLLA